MQYSTPYEQLWRDRYSKQSTEELKEKRDFMDKYLVSFSPGDFVPLVAIIDEILEVRRNTLAQPLEEKR